MKLVPLTVCHGRRGPDLPGGMLRDVAPLLLRLIVGFGFMAHGHAKLVRGPAQFAVVLHALGIHWAVPLAWLTTLVELVGGLAVLVGFYVPLAAIPMSIVLIAAMVTVHYPYGFASVRLAEVSANGIRFGPVGYELVLLYLAGLGALVCGGSGRFSVEAISAWHRTRKAARNAASA